MSAACRCGARWESLTVCHCGTCHLTFGGVSGFDEHRFQGRCRTPAELTERGMAPNTRGQWRHPRPTDSIPQQRTA